MTKRLWILKHFILNWVISTIISSTDWPRQHYCSELLLDTIYLSGIFRLYMQGKILVIIRKIWVIKHQFYSSYCFSWRFWESYSHKKVDGNILLKWYQLLIFKLIPKVVIIWHNINDLSFDNSIRSAFNFIESKNLETTWLYHLILYAVLN